mgnify:CR=1 FL=1
MNINKDKLSKVSILYQVPVFVCFFDMLYHKKIITVKFIRDYRKSPRHNINTNLIVISNIFKSPYQTIGCIWFSFFSPPSIKELNIILSKPQGMVDRFRFVILYHWSQHIILFEQGMVGRFCLVILHQSNIYAYCSNLIYTHVNHYQQYIK